MNLNAYGIDIEEDLVLLKHVWRRYSERELKNKRQLSFPRHLVQQQQACLALFLSATTFNPMKIGPLTGYIGY